MWVLYLIGVSAYGFAIRFATLFNPKAKEWITGRRGWQSQMKESFSNKTEKRIWFHCASLGEFEQGRPLLEAIKKNYPNHKIVLTFFSPSGYNIKKNDAIADYVFYMPLDGRKRSAKFLDLVKPSLVFFVKYEFWYFYGKELHKRKIPFFCVSAIFRPGQVFFHRFGGFFRKILMRFTHLFVQDQDSLQQLYKYRITNVTVSGDTRFDRVFSNSMEKIKLPEIESFCGSDQVFICGSTWPLDELVLLPFIKENKSRLKFIIAPHEINPIRLNKLKSELNLKSVFYSDWKNNTTQSYEVLIIDHVGMLSQLYRYGHYAYIGGGFGSGIHNILEAVVFGLPVFFGPNYQKFREARDLVKLNAAFPVKDSANLKNSFNAIELDEQFYNKIMDCNKQFIRERRGATNVVMGYLMMNYPGE